MPQTFKKLAGSAGNGVIGTAATIYTASGTAGTSTVISTITICNTSSTSATYSICLTTASNTFAAADYIVYQATIAGNDMIGLTLGLTMDPTYRFLNVSSSTASVVFSAFGVENS